MILEVDHKVKSFSRSAAIEAGKADPDCNVLGAFTLIKDRNTGHYDYVPGGSCILLSSDIPQADYYLSLQGEWRHTLRGAK